VPAQRVLVEMAIANDGADVEIYESLPDAPLPGHPGAPRIRLAHGHPGIVVVDTEQDGYRLQIDCGDMQPGRFLVTDWFYAGRATSGDIVFDGRIYADNLERPSEFTLRIVFNVQQSAVTSEELKTFARKGYKRK
jgi:hypothetical protein